MNFTKEHKNENIRIRGNVVVEDEHQTSIKKTSEVIKITCSKEQ